MAEGPVLELLGRIKDRRQRRLAGWQHDWHDSYEGGQSPGMRGQINPLDSQAISDRSQGVEVSEVAPPSPPQARMEGFSEASEPAPQESPFKFASGSEAKEGAVKQTQYTKVCGPNGCQMVPVQPQAQFSTPTQPSFTGEQVVPGSERVISTRILSGPQGSVTATTEGVPFLSPMAQRIEQIKALGGMPNGDASAWMLNRGMASEETGAAPGLNIYGQARMSRDAAFWNRAALMERQAQRAEELLKYKQGIANRLLEHEQKAAELQLQKEQMSTPEGRVSLEERILGNHSMSPQARAQIIQEMNMRGRADAQVQYSPQQLADERDLLEGRAAGKTVASHVVNTGIVSGALKPTNAMQATEAAKQHDHGTAAWQTVLNRYGSMDAKNLQSNMYRDLFPPIRDSILAARTGGVLELTPEMENSANNEASVIIDAYHSRVVNWQSTQPRTWAQFTGWSLRPAAPQQQQQQQAAQPAATQGYQSPSRASLLTAPRPAARQESPSFDLPTTGW